MAKKNVVVTGGAGFIGSHLIERLINEGHHVTVIDNFINGREENLEKVINSQQLRIEKVSILDYKNVLPLFKNIDWVFHLAALADIVPSIEMPRDYFEVNVDGTFNVLQASAESKIKRFIYAASSSCYGIPDEYPTNENAQIRPQYPYALTKYLGEELVRHWGKVYKLPYLSLRLFNVYGPRVRTSGTYGAVFGVFLAQKLAGKPFTVVGDGSQTRDFTYVTDVVDAFVTAARSTVKYEVFNVGSDNTYSVNKLVQLLCGEIEYIPKRPGEPDCTFADISKIKQQLNWHPQVNFDDGVQNMLKNIGYWRNAPVWEASNIKEATQSWFKYLKEETAK